MRYLKTLGWLALSLVAIAPIIIITYEPRGVVPTLQAAELIGAFVGVFGLAAILTTVVFLIRRKNQSLQYPGLGTGVVIVLLSGMGILGSNIGGVRTQTGEAALTSFTYRPKHCGYRVSFPAQHKIEVQHIPREGLVFEVERAEASDAHGYYRAECLPIHVPSDAAEETASNLAVVEGLQRGSMQRVNAEVVEGQGYKIVKGKEVIVVMRVYHGGPTTLAAMVATTPALFPTPQSRNFFGSVIKEPR